MLKREKHKMPPDVKNALVSNTKLLATKTKRLNQMLKELKVGGVYMNMKHPASAKHSKKKAR